MNEDDSLLDRITNVEILGEIMQNTPKNHLPDAEVNTIAKDASVKKKLCKREWASTSIHYSTLVILGTVSWGMLWCAFGDDWRWDGKWFRMAAVAVVAWATGQILEGLTTLPQLIAALLTGILARHFGILDMRQYTHIDLFLRKIYPVIILGKGSLAWDVSYMKRNWRRVISLGMLPWTAELTTLAICTHLLLGFPWIWGFLLATFYSSVSCPVIMAAVQKHSKNSDRKQNWPQLICTAGGVDTALSVGVFGVIYSVMFYETNYLYRYTKAALSLFAGSAVGVIWGSLARFLPNSRDTYVTELRVLFVLVGGLFVNFFTSLVGWGGTGCVAVLACNSTAANHWANKGWKLNQNPAAKVYRVLWSGLEPILFAYTGTFFVMNRSVSNTMLIGLGILFICLAVRLFVTFLMCWDLTLREKIFVCCCWVPKSIVEAVLAPMALATLLVLGNRDDDLVYAEQILWLTIQAILITTPVGFLLTNNLGPVLLQNKSKNSQPQDQLKQETKVPHRSIDEDIRL